MNTKLRRRALYKAANEMESIIWHGDMAEISAICDGETGRESAISARDSLLEDPAAWLRELAGENK